MFNSSDLFQIPEKEVADEWDGHTPQEAADRLYEYLLRKQGVQEPAWSEGDEKTLDKIIVELTPFKKCPDNAHPIVSDYYANRSRMISWLKIITENYKKTQK